MSATLHTHKNGNRGFTLIEALTAVAIIGILGGLAVTGFMYGTTRARANNATFELSAMFSVGQLRATSSGRPHYLVLWQSSTTAYGAQLLDYTGSGSVPAWSTMTPGSPPNTFAIIDTVNMASSSETRVALPTLANAKSRIPSIALLSAYPSPFQSVPMTASGGSQWLSQACSFCVDQMGGSLGVVRFNVEGTVDVLTGVSTNPPGGSFALEVSTTGNQNDPRILAFSAPLATLKVYR